MLIYQLVVGEKGRPYPPQVAPYFCDVRDVAVAHVRALDVPPAKDIQQKRYLLCAGQFLYQDVARLLMKIHPEVADRLPSLETAQPAPGPFAITDTSRAASELHISKYIGWEETVTAMFDDLLAAEKGWADKSA